MKTASLLFANMSPKEDVFIQKAFGNDDEVAWSNRPGTSVKKIGKLFLSVGKECIFGIKRDLNRDHEKEWYPI